MNTRVIIVDDHELFRTGIKMAISKIKDTTVIGEAANGSEFLTLLDKINGEVDIVLLDIQMPVMNGIEAAEKALAKYPGLNIIALTMFNEDHYVESMMDAGVKGFLLKNITREKLAKAIETITNGGNYYSEELWEFFTKRIVQQQHAARETGVEVKLTKREEQILQLLSQGYSNKEIADKLFVSERTIVGHKSNLLSKTQCKNTLCLITYAVKNKMVDL